MGLYAVDYKTLTGDTGYKNAASIQPILNGEPAREDILGRPDETIRVRSDILRDLLVEQRQINDLDRSLVLIGGGTLTFTGSAVVDTGTITASLSMYLLGMATPGGGGSPTYLDSTKSTLSVGTLANNEMIVTSVQDAYQSANAVTSRVNLISLEIVDGGVAAPLVVAVEGAPAAHIKVTIEAGVHTVQNVITAINAHVGANVLVLATLGAGSTAGNPSALFSLTQWGSDLTARYLRGGAAGTAHEITSGGLSSFFATVANRLQKGDTLAVSYDKILNSTTTGGRLQSTPENANLNVDGALFNTRRNPEKIPNSLPIAKCVDDNTVVFVNGRYIVKGTSGTFKVDSVSGANAAIDSGPFIRLDVAPVPHIPPVTLQQAFNNTDVLLDALMTEVTTARTGVWGAAVSLDARLEADSLEVTTARNSLAYATLYATLDARLEVPEAEIIGARATDSLDTPGFGGYANVNARLDRHADHSRVFVSVSDLGGINAMFSNLKTAVDYLNTTLTGGTIHCIDTVSHDVTSSAGTQFPVIVRPIRIIGQDKVTITDNRTGTSTILTFSTGSEGSLLDNVDIVAGGTPSKRAIQLNASRVTLRNAVIAGEVAIGQSNTPNECVIEQCSITTTEASRSAVTVQAGLRHNIRATTMSALATGAKAVSSVTTGISALFDSCAFDAQFDAFAVSLTVSTGYVSLTDCTVNVGTIVNIAGGGVTAVVLSGAGVNVRNMIIQLTGALQVFNNIVNISASAQVDTLLVDGNDRLLNYTDTTTQNPVRVRSSANVTNLTVRNFTLPNDTDDGFTLTGDEPVVNIEGTSVTLPPTVLRNLRMTGFKTGATPAGTQRWVFVGPKGTLGTNQAATAAQNLRLLDAQIVLKSTEMNVTAASHIERCILSNFGDRSEIRGCAIIGDATWSSYAVRIRMTNGLRFIDNTLTLTAFIHATAALLNFFDGTNLKVDRNQIYYVTNATNGSKAIQVSNPTTFTVNDNVIERSNTSAATDEVIEISVGTQGTVIGNAITTDGSPTDPIDYAGATTNVIPADTFQNTLNAI